MSKKSFTLVGKSGRPVPTLPKQGPGAEAQPKFAKPRPWETRGRFDKVVSDTGIQVKVVGIVSKDKERAIWPPVRQELAIALGVEPGCVSLTATLSANALIKTTLLRAGVKVDAVKMAEIEGVLSDRELPLKAGGVDFKLSAYHAPRMQGAAKVEVVLRGSANMSLDSVKAFLRSYGLVTPVARRAAKGDFVITMDNEQQAKALHGVAIIDSQEGRYISMTSMVELRAKQLEHEKQAKERAQKKAGVERQSKEERTLAEAARIKKARKEAQKAQEAELKRQEQAEKLARKKAHKEEKKLRKAELKAARKAKKSAAQEADAAKVKKKGKKLAKALKKAKAAEIKDEDEPMVDDGGVAPMKVSPETIQKAQKVKKSSVSAAQKKAGDKGAASLKASPAVPAKVQAKPSEAESSKKPEQSPSKSQAQQEAVRGKADQGEAGLVASLLTLVSDLRDELAFVKGKLFPALPAQVAVAQAYKEVSPAGPTKKAAKAEAPAAGPGAVRETAPQGEAAVQAVPAAEVKQVSEGTPSPVQVAQVATVEQANVPQEQIQQATAQPMEVGPIQGPEVEAELPTPMDVEESQEVAAAGPPAVRIENVGVLKSSVDMRGSKMERPVSERDPNAMVLDDDSSGEDQHAAVKKQAVKRQNVVFQEQVGLLELLQQPLQEAHGLALAESLEKKRALLNEGAVQKLAATKKSDKLKEGQAAAKKALEKKALENAQAAQARLPVKMQNAILRQRLEAEAAIQAAQNRTELLVNLGGGLLGQANLKRLETGWSLQTEEDMMDAESWVRFINGDRELTEEGKFVGHAKELETMSAAGEYRLLGCVVRDNSEGALAAMLAGSRKSQ